MPADISNSSSEDEEDTQTTASTDLPEQIVTKPNAYKCPEDFVSFTHKPCSGTLSNSLKNKNTELWLIKAPASFNPERFSGVAVPLSGLQTVRVPAAAPGAEAASGGGLRQGLYSVLAAKRSPTDLHLLTAAGPASARVLCGPAFSGVLNVCEIYGDSGDALLRPQAIPAAPAPVIPPGLKQRFLPFGSKTPTLTCVAESELDAGATGPSSATLLPRVVKHFPTEEEMTAEERRKERKRRKREMRIKLESGDPAEEGVEVKLEAVEEEERMESIEAGLLEERRRKKKRKKDKERARERGAAAALEEALREVEVVVKCEPIDFSYEDHEGSAKRKKKKRKSRAEED
ncbi:CD3e molecule, epsilon associated protein [Gadus chalcogrammus]|uniref:CD3e molecule, epsilon associated protein n=1 Tax=Gadus chalcogrammus TaxID=1042646 RepID=UPI0024C49D47|nr:CD3e molecule, epsilon associated protein [Gadus chalcogrammus]